MPRKRKVKEDEHKQRQTTIRLPEWLFEAFDAEALEVGLERAALMRNVLVLHARARLKALAREEALILLASEK